MGVQPQPWPTNYSTGKIIQHDSWFVMGLAEFLEKELK